jgi:hypothetical protein
MFQRLLNAIRPSKGSSLSRAFFRLGWAGFWIQVVFGSIPVLVMVYYAIFSRSSTASENGLAFIKYLVIADLLLLLFTIYWSYRYTRVARRLMDPDRRPSEAHVIGTAWTGVVASTAGIVFSMIVMLIETATLLFYFLRAPQGGVPVFQTSATGAVYYVSSVDMVNLMALMLALFAEQIVLVFSLWLLFRTTLGSPELQSGAPQPPTAGESPEFAEVKR